MCIREHGKYPSRTGHVLVLWTARTPPVKQQDPTYPPPPDDAPIRVSKNNHDKANAYIRMILFRKRCPMLVDSGCDTTLVPKSLIACFHNIEVWPSTSYVWAASNTPIEIYSET